MRLRVIATLVAAVFFSIFVVSATGVGRVKHYHVAVEYPISEVQNFLKKVVSKRKKCQKTLRAGGEAEGICSEMKVLLTLEAMLKSYVALEQKYEKLKGDTQAVTAENSQLKAALDGIRSPASVEESKSCYKSRLLHELMVDEGINFNGNNLFTKKPVGQLGVCWSNSKKKKEATITLCNYPLAIYFKTMGGTDRFPVVRERQYIFNLKGCDLIVVDIHEESQQGKKDTFLNYDHCKEMWNKRTADAAMTPQQVRLMEDTIGACFRYHLLPPRNEEGGRVNPNVPTPPAAKNLAPKGP